MAPSALSNGVRHFRVREGPECDECGRTQKSWPVPIFEGVAPHDTIQAQLENTRTPEPQKCAQIQNIAQMDWRSEGSALSAAAGMRSQVLQGIASRICRVGTRTTDGCSRRRANERLYLYLGEPSVEIVAERAGATFS